MRAIEASISRLTLLEISRGNHTRRISLNLLATIVAGMVLGVKANRQTTIPIEPMLSVPAVCRYRRSGRRARSSKDRKPAPTSCSSGPLVEMQFESRPAIRRGALGVSASVSYTCLPERMVPGRSAVDSTPPLFDRRRNFDAG